MAQKRSLWFYFAVILVILSTLTQETEARRKILRGRRVMTRTYYRGNAVPAWAISLMAGIGMLLIGGVLYVVMRKIVLSSETGSLNTYQPAMQQDV
ncbi:uncharacterized protein LOC110376355 [Helicoverpa armigera]|uniref:uncharacterized protein LOC110376355 n=1 Tax=Helicoverpa armigera TaxID=29058 RepID=UPI000B396ECE|nr:uncharacterized protein LOC110376355 [Helicoverpa armigera]XP_047024498.1 uncharacterized protein LOC124633351 [Helicoverpa zea]PZC86523.1 hypothetical protein B5X24_HaOG209242 [Helicoverpa armigera]